MKQFANKAFTLVELLIVIGIIGLLAVTVLLTLNPAEAQKRTRDTKRIKDAQTLQAVVEQYISDGNAIPAAWATPTVGITSQIAGNVQGQTCAATNWLGVDVCNYTKTVPTDPLNSRTASCAQAGSTTAITNCPMNYQLRVNGAGSTDYEIRVRQESVSNAQKLGSDGGSATDTRWFEVFSGPNNVLVSSTTTD